MEKEIMLCRIKEFLPAGWILRYIANSQLCDVTVTLLGMSQDF